VADWASILATIAIVVSLAAVAISWRQLREARRTNSFPAALDLFREYRSLEMVQARALLRSDLAGYPADQGIRELPGAVGHAARKVSHYLDNLGVLVDNGLMDPQLAAGFLGNNVIEMWDALAPFIRADRARGPVRGYQRYFESLVVAVEKANPDEVIAKLPRRDPV
jgi:hypothetical protein